MTGSDAYEAAGGLDRVIHEPARLLLTTALHSVDGSDFVFLQNLSGLTKGNLSSHLAKLEQAGYIAVTKTGAGRRARTWVELTGTGRAAVTEHWKHLDRLRALADVPHESADRSGTGP
ncbi:MULTISPECIES: transcriptional regulator [Nocardiopsidaceae]|uniref:DNA-binding MarR family transcriptional regulator n=1 Tax=Streptomonospora salina TaxID=104205 RepID=A0A841ECZ5_9ACTN|nr:MULTISPECIES: transcriptional regulator [Nocardiopsaceae]MBB5999189.1 DNA-binding MarR family transcriptional regulator [Streptomonospora salina]